MLKRYRIKKKVLPSGKVLFMPEVKGFIFWFALSPEWFTEIETARGEIKKHKNLKPRTITIVEEYGEFE